MKHPIGIARNNTPVYVDLIASPAATHIARQPHLLELVREVLRNSSPRGPVVNIEYDMGRPIGYSFIVSTTDDDSVVYAQIIRDKVFTRFVKTGKPNATQHVTVVLHRDTDGEYELRDVWIGRMAPPRPGSGNETEDSHEFWKTHAYLLDSQIVQPRSVTRTCPY